MMIDLIGKRFDRLTVIKYCGKDKWNNYMWLCKCDCGNKKNIRSSHLNHGEVKSCGCFNREMAKQRMTTHGHTKNGKWSKIYHTWSSIITRCTNLSSSEYKNYGARGIKVCKRWRKFENFIKDMGERPEGKSIDRINNNQGYFKGNCRWVTPKEQARNRRNNKLITFKAKTQCLSKWAEEFNMNPLRLWQRIFKLNWTVEKALTTLIRKQKNK